MMRITFSTATPRKRPQLGDRKIIDGVEHVREWEVCHDAQGRPIGYNLTGGRPHYVWVPVQEAA